MEYESWCCIERMEHDEKDMSCEDQRGCADVTMEQDEMVGDMESDLDFFDRVIERLMQTDEVVVMEEKPPDEKR